MSLPSSERDDGAASMEEDHLDLSPDGDAASSDGETIRPEREYEEVSDLVEERTSIIFDPPTENGPIANRYRQLMRDRDDASEEGSAEGLPRRAGSPIDSLLSAQDDSPSLGVSDLLCYRW